MLRLAPLRRSLLRRALLASRTSVATVAPAVQLLLVQKRRAIHTTRSLLETPEHSHASRDDSDEPDIRPKMDGAFIICVVSMLLLFGIYDYTSDAAPFRVTPSELVKQSFSIVAENELVASRLGAELFAYGDFNESGDELDHDHVVDSASLRDECISHAVIEQDCGRDRIKATYTTTKIKFNIKGSKGRAVVFARVQDDQKNGQYVYLLVTFAETGETLEIIDNREELTAPVWKENAVKGHVKSK